MGASVRCSLLAAFATLALMVAGAAARPQFFGIGSSFQITTSSPGRRPATNSPRRLPGGAGVGAGLAPVTRASPLERTGASDVQLVAASTTLGVCPTGAKLLLNEEVVRRPIPGMRVSTVVRYDGRGCFGDRDCTVSCVKVDAPHKDWRPSGLQISDGRLGGSGIQVTLQSPVGQGYSVRLLIYGLCSS